MKIIFNVLGVFIIIGTLLGVTYYVVSRNSLQPQKVSDTQPLSFPSAGDVVPPLQNQKASAGTQPDIAKAFYSQQKNSERLTLGGTVIAGTYALQPWGDENTGGEALLQYSPQGGWRVLPVPSGGAWDVPGLVSLGIPQNTAEELIAGRGW